jgi:hypothetical protein
MKVADNFLALKLETLQIILALQDSAKLQRIRAVLEETDPTPQVILDLIKRRQEASKADHGTPLAEYLEEIKDL